MGQHAQSETAVREAPARSGERAWCYSLIRGSAGCRVNLSSTSTSLARLDEEACRAEEHRDVRVVTANMHPAVVLGGEGQSALIVQRSASMLARRRIVRPGSAPSIVATTELTDLPSLGSRPRS